MPRPLRWALAIGLAGLLIVGGALLLPFSDWFPGGTVAGISKQEVVNGTAFNRLFPAPAAGEDLVFSQEKRGFSEARLKRDGAVVALLAISDTSTAPEARAKFESASEAIAGWPLVEQGPQASALLVADRFQVKVIGQGSGLDPQRRHALLGAFDLPRIAALEPSRQSRTKPRGQLAEQLGEALPAAPPATLQPQPELQPAA
ncbi:hypothetical protein KQ313_12230 [Synechococcus sp. CS-1325]|uniref:hypothetical protein n=1 Tax=unclassified Synechococcus TaxID=2626047 RepID=UPI0021A5E45D|nr:MULTISPECIES: hypothetical protein [unclassified Synechococcus]MCT0200443.1 hypothetical protein [Synechococcus sp. CS-1325]MCT0213054.1 hypothetical protein [Synechococcus sp. CS-1326]MCT0229788.1 hypothetical protein [Synechococcus sp. CS-1324]MCT0232299.1 hypothetical protein [Synechococcus sp. CS-1327]